MKRYLAIVMASVLGLLALAALARGMIGWAQGPGEGGSGAPGLSSANIPDGVEVSSPPDLPAGVGVEDIESAQAYNASLRIAGSVLRPRDSNVQWAASGSGGCIYATSGDQYTIWNVPVYLPQGATVKYLRMHFYDTNASSNSVAWFTVYDQNGNVANEWSVSSSGSAGAGYVTSSEFTHTVNYENYSYVVNWRPYALGSGMQVCGFRIYYQTPPGYTYLPLVTKEH